MNGLAWCRLCGSEHPEGRRCPRGVFTTEPEERGWRIAVETPRGVEGYGVLLAPAAGRWRSRIITFPNVLWIVPGGGESMKFLTKSREQAERLAIEFIRRHCLAKGYTMRDDVDYLGAPTPEILTGSQPLQRIVAPRFRYCMPVRFGRDRPVLFGKTFNMSETGLFVHTDQPMAEGEMVGISLAIEYGKVPLRGNVSWHRMTRSTDRPPGMGLKLFSPPSLYVNYVRALC